MIWMEKKNQSGSREDEEVKGMIWMEMLSGIHEDEEEDCDNYYLSRMEIIWLWQITWPT